MRLSVVIPTLNEADQIAAAIEALRQRTVGPEPEILVMDSGSVDDTVRIARKCNVRVEVDPALSCRAEACNAGAAQTTGDVLLFLHADSRVPERFDVVIRDVLASEGVTGGAFEFALDGPEWRLRIVEWINRIRYRVRGQFFGDQGIFVRRVVFDEVAGFPPTSILEDAHFCALARRVGPMRLARSRMLTSPRRFYNGGILTTLALDIVIVLIDLAGLDLRRFAIMYRRDNVRRGSTRSVARGLAADRS